MLQRKLLVGLVILGLALLVSGCNDDDDEFAPESFAGRTYRLVIEEATGVAVTTAPGSYRIEFLTDGTYLAIPETDNLTELQGPYTYTKVDDNNGEMTYTTTLRPGVVYTCVFTFTSSDAGIYTMTLSGADGSQLGTFSGTFQQI